MNEWIKIKIEEQQAYLFHFLCFQSSNFGEGDNMWKQSRAVFKEKAEHHSHKTLETCHK